MDRCLLVNDVSQNVIAYLAIFQWNSEADQRSKWQRSPRWSVFNVALVCCKFRQAWDAYAGEVLLQQPPVKYEFSHGRTLLHVAAENLAHPALVKSLLKEMPDTVEKRDHHVWTPLHLMVMQTPAKPINPHDEASKQYWNWVHTRQASLVEEFLDLYPAVASKRDGKDGLALHWACSRAPQAALVMIRRRPGDAKKGDEQSRLPLHVCAMKLAATVLVTEVLNAHSEGARARDSHGKMPISYAAEAVRENLQCPQGHALSYGIDRTPDACGHICDLCHQTIPTNIVMFSCVTCDFDLCSRCTPHSELLSILRKAASPKQLEAEAYLAYQVRKLKAKLEVLRARQAALASGEADLYTILNIPEFDTESDDEIDYV